MTVTVTGKVDDETEEEIQKALEPLLVENGVDSSVVTLGQLSMDVYGNMEVTLHQRSSSES